VPNDPPANMSEFDVQNFLQTAIAQSSVPTPSSNTIYSMYMPPSVTITGSEGTSCVSYGGFHDAMTLTTGQRVYFAVLARCSTSVSLLDEMSFSVHAYRLLQVLSTAHYPIPIFSISRSGAPKQPMFTSPKLARARGR
jgi:hypothetical protein